MLAFMSENGARFLHQQHPDLYQLEGVRVLLHPHELSQQPEEILAAYLQRAQAKPDYAIIDDLDTYPVDNHREDRTNQLHDWKRHLLESNDIEPWLKCHVWRSILSAEALPELNEEAFNLATDALDRVHEKQERPGSVTQEGRFQNLIMGGAFNKLYEYLLAEVELDLPALRQQTQGEWRIYEQSDKPANARRLASSLSARGSGWCTSAEKHAREQLSEGDFHVYYTLDTEGQPTIPRIAVRMEDGKIDEIRGVDRYQELELSMIDIMLDQIKDMPGANAYLSQAQNLKRLQEVAEKVRSGNAAVLSKEDLRFIYEIGSHFESFGRERHPQFELLSQSRGSQDRQQLSEIFEEVITEQLPSAYAMYDQVFDHLSPYVRQRIWQKSPQKLSEAEFSETFAQKWRQWAAAQAFGYLSTKFLEEGAKDPILVATPNLRVGQLAVISLAREYASGGLDNSFVHRTKLYTADQWSGYERGGPAVRFSIVPAEIDHMHRLAIPEAIENLRNSQNEYPDLRLHMPSLLEAVCYWHSLRAQDPAAMTLERTTTAHFDLPTVYTSVRGWAYLHANAGEKEARFCVLSPDTHVESRLAIG